MASRSINDLEFKIRVMAVRHVSECAKQGIDLLIYCTYRSDFEQDQLFARGRATPGVKVTNCKGGQSKHNIVSKLGKPSSKAYDCVPIVNGKAVWDDKELYEKIGAIGKKIGLIWGGYFKSIKDYPHFEI